MRIKSSLHSILLSIIFLSLLFPFPHRVYSQDGENPLPFVPPPRLYDTAPQFPGGPNAMIRFFADSIRYPEPEHSGGKEGLVMTKFKVMANGKISNVELINGVAGAPNLAREAVRVLYSMPVWSPAILDGERVEAEYYLSIPFKITFKQGQ